MRVELDWPEAAIAAQVGMRRQIEALRQHRPDRHGFDGEDGWTIHIEGAAGEMAVAKLRNRYWNGSVNTFKTGGDVGAVQVRTRSKAHYDLIVRDDDRNDDAFFLVIGRIPVFDVVGWIKGRDAKRPEWLQTYGERPPAYFVPQSALTL